MIYTIGHRVNYLKAMQEVGGSIRKLGKRGSGEHTDFPMGYPGGFAFQTIEEAQRAIEEHDKLGEWGVFGLEADWEIDTEPSPDGWWHNLLRDATIIVIPATPAHS